MNVMAISRQLTAMCLFQYGRTPERTARITIPRMRRKNEEPVEKGVVYLPLTHHELLVMTRCLDIACESAHADPADKHTAGLIRDRIVRFAERQGASWDSP